MSNTPPSPVVLRIQQSALIFIVLALAIGALLLASNSIDPKAGQRPGILYSPWSSPDGLVSLEYPKDWKVESSVDSLGLAYRFKLSDTSNILFDLELTRTELVPLITAKPGDSPDELAKNLETQLLKLAPTAGITTAVSIGNLKGVTLNHSGFAVSSTATAATQDSTSASGETTPEGPPITIDRDFWFMALDPTHVIFAVGQYPSGDKATYQPVMQHIMESVSVQIAPAIKAVDAQPTPTPTPTSTPVPTNTNTPLPTATNTPLPTNTNTPLPTATYTPSSTNTNTPLPTATYTPTSTNTNTPLPTATNTPLPTNTNTPLPTNTNTSLPTATNTPLPTSTNTPLPTNTNTPLPTATNTPVPTNTIPPLPTNTPATAQANM